MSCLKRLVVVREADHCALAESSGPGVPSQSSIPRFSFSFCSTDFNRACFTQPLACFSLSPDRVALSAWCSTTSHCT